MADKKILRHSPVVRTIHWLTAISVFVLIFSGIGQMPMYKRYLLSSLPGMTWTADYHVTLIIHYVASAVLLFAVMFHIVYHFMRKEYDIIPKKGDIKESFLIIKAMFGFGEEPPSSKYLAEQRLAYIYIAFSILLVIVTGMIKVVKNFPQFAISEATMIWVTLLHNLGMFLVILGIIAHLGAFIIKANRKLLPSMINGYVSEEYVKHRHSLWFNELTAKSINQNVSDNLNNNENNHASNNAISNTNSKADNKIDNNLNQ